MNKPNDEFDPDNEIAAQETAAINAQAQNNIRRSLALESIIEIVNTAQSTDEYDMLYMAIRRTLELYNLI